MVGYNVGFGTDYLLLPNTFEVLGLLFLTSCRSPW